MNEELDRVPLAEDEGYPENAIYSEDNPANTEQAEIALSTEEGELSSQNEGEEYYEDGLPDEDSAYGENEEVYENAPEGEKIDYEELMRSDLTELKEEFPELGALGSIAQLNNPLRYAALRDMGLSPREAYLAASYRPKRADNRSHLKKTVPGGVKDQRSGMSRSELLYARELFSGMSDSDIYALYKRVSE